MIGIQESKFLQYFYVIIEVGCSNNLFFIAVAIEDTTYCANRINLHLNKSTKFQRFH